MKIVVYLEPRFERPAEAAETAVFTNISDEGKAGIEAALQLKERYGGEVTAVTVGNDPAEEVLREAFAMGVDHGAMAAKVENTVASIAAAIQKVGGDVVVSGYAEKQEIGKALHLDEIFYDERSDVKKGFVYVKANSVKPRYMHISGVFAAYKHPIITI